MKQVREQWIEIINKYTTHSDIICFSILVSKNKFTEKQMAKWFNKLVDKKEYDKEIKNKLIKFYLKKQND